MKKEIIALSSLLCVGTLSADWRAVETFEDGTADGFTVEFNGADVATTQGSASVVADPFGLGQGMVYEIAPGIAGTATHNVIAGVTLPDADQIEFVGGGAKATFYAKVGIPLVAGNPGIADVAFGMGGDNFDGTDVVPIGPVYQYSNFSAYCRISDSGIFDYRDEGTGFVPFGDTQANTDTYYSIWWVVDHEAQTYDVYVQGGTDYPAQTQVATGAAYRNQTFENLSKFFMLSSAGNTTQGVKGRDPFYLDDIYVDPTQENLTGPGDDPVSGAFVNIATRGNVGTGDDVMIAGFVIDGDEPKEVLIQGVGPELGLGGVLADPFLTLVPEAGGDAIVNDNWDS
ncbi:hypothetical protein MLD52_18030, partial [Puniceicoccaceae bacterium K14]|nr:hypothetical protein [Puniceicoccaceae bacterium K14]